MQILVKYGPPPTSLPVPKYGMPIPTDVISPTVVISPTDVIAPGGISTGTLLALAGVIVLVAIGAWVGFRLLLGQKAGKK
jgi:hypothetical protein